VAETIQILVRIRDLRYSYPGGPEILRIPALDISGRGLIAVTGPSGAGKSTLVELLAGTLHEGYEGSVEVLGKEWRDLRRDADRQRHLRRIGFIPQDFGLLPSKTPRETLKQDLVDADVPVEVHASRIEQALSEMELTELADQRISSLSGGQGQRVVVARMLAREVDLVIADEPTANLDPGLREVVMGLLRRMSQHVPVIVVTHDAAVAESCDRTIILQTASPRSDAPALAAPSKGRSRRARVTAFTVLALIAAAALAVVGYSIAGAPAKSLVSTSTTPPASTSTTTSTTLNSTVVDVAIPVVECPTVNMQSPNPPPRFPSTIGLALPRSLSNGLTFYSDSVRSFVPILGPRGWQCSFGYGVDGGISIQIYPLGTSPSSFDTAANAQFVTAYTTGAASGEALFLACPFFPSAIQQLTISHETCPQPRPTNERATSAYGSFQPSTSNGGIVAFYLPAHTPLLGQATRDYASQGVEEFSGVPEPIPSSTEETCVLPPSESAICKEIATQFLTGSWGSS